MIGTVIAHVTSELNYYVCQKQGVSPDVTKVSLSSIVGPDGQLAILEDNQILVTLVDIRQDAIAPTWKKAVQRDVSGADYGVNRAAFNINLFLLFSVYFPSDLKTGLDHLSYVFQFFLTRSSLDRQNSPNLPAGISRLTFEMVTQDFQEKGHMMGLLGAKYLPSTLYKMSMLTFLDSEPEEFRPAITQVGTKLT
ncbi:MAG: DUF4255 domain-containing protein [Bacteroidia bacterium]|nr:DUF4255 domain-containing protein [Bacteroidia bacterium]